METQEMGITSRSNDTDGAHAAREQVAETEGEILQISEANVVVVDEHGVSAGTSGAVDRRMRLQIELRGLLVDDVLVHDESGIHVAVAVAVEQALK